MPVGRGLATIDCVPIVCLVFEQLQTWDNDVTRRNSRPKMYHRLNSIGHRAQLLWTFKCIHFDHPETIQMYIPW